MSGIKLTRESALDLVLEGSIGSFSVGTGKPGQNSLEVKYFLTHVGLDFSAGSNEKVLNHLAPVREIFDFEQLDFDEIMQRDIDDARVSAEIVPYLLDSKSRDLIKLFPPIVVVILPVQENDNRPGDLYPKVEMVNVEEGATEEGALITRSGVTGSEAFEFEQPIMDGKPINHDLTRLRLNTSKTRLVIVDGQHRAMALLALYRNLKDEWSDAKREPFKEYYAEWTPNYIREFELQEINLPVMYCTFPDLCEGYEGDLDLKKAAREIFLTLNKNARKVSNSRNTLLDDGDLISLFLRRCLSTIKQKDARSPKSLRIWNVELDQIDDRMKVRSSIAITGVNHVQYFIEHLMLNQSSDVNGAKPRSGKFYKRTDLDIYGMFERLNARDLLGTEVADSTQRRTFTTDAAAILAESFDSRYAAFIIGMFEIFEPYERHNRAVMQVEANLQRNQDRKLRPILFEGQGIGRVFEDHRTNLSDKLQKGGFETDVPKIEALKRELDATAERIYETTQAFKLDRANRYMNDVSDKSKLKGEIGVNPNVVRFTSDMYDNVFTTVAFESALICTFFGEIEKLKSSLDKEEFDTVSIIDCFNEYLEQLNTFFIPSTSAKFRRLVNLFLGRIDGEISDWKLISPAPEGFRSVVYRGEMQPDQWPKYKYLFLEIWKPANERLQSIVLAERDHCRNQIFQSLHEHKRDAFIKDNMKLEEDFIGEDHRTIFDSAYDAFSDFLKLVQGSTGIPNKTQLKAILAGESSDAEEDSLDEEEWSSVES